MKILYVYEKMPSTYQQYLLNLLQIVKSSLAIKTLAYEEDSSADYIIKTYGFKDYIQRILFQLKVSKYKALDAIVFDKFDIIHLQHSFLFNKIIPLLQHPKTSKIVITLRGGDTYIKPWIDKRWKDFYSKYGNLVDAYITVSQNQKEYLLKWGISENKIHVIPVSFGLESKAKPKYPNPNKLHLVSAFRMTWEKNIEGSIKFAKLLKDRGIDFQYDIYGNGNDLGQLYYLVDKYDLTDVISIKGKIDNDLLKKELVRYDFFVQLSVSEALSVSVLEAQAVGLPCIISNAGGLPEAVIKDKTAIVYDYNEINKMIDKCLEVWNDRERYFLYSTNAIEYVNTNFTLRHEEEKLTELYKSLL
ncbi:glycosyltransferase family 4 protein [Flavobacterium jejuense]|uniref:Glycosyltransferase family 4 protein n=1 Tax=Flavobacterium jejuense TaxID=1544455 RepID=A0ABX0IR32_9FLAO|nr:glycosyltransferase family 4 protein [Flavobacterium jejuense]NHN26168.1 glycosyltransferase family 4 protein [Flavobacterium jejuense]